MNDYHHGFIAELNGKQVDLSWITLQNSTVNYFEIERSPNGYDFEMLLKINAIEEKDGELFYRTKEKNPIEGDNFYRLKKYLNNGEIQVSEIQKVVYQPEQFSLDLYPNPTDGKLFVQTKNSDEEKIAFRIMNNLSQAVKEFKFDKVEPLIELELSDLPNGVYYLIFQSGENTEVKQVLIQR